MEHDPMACWRGPPAALVVTILSEFGVRVIWCKELCHNNRDKELAEGRKRLQEEWERDYFDDDHILNCKLSTC